MSNLNTVPEGAPLTYELINNIINAINQLQKTDTGVNQIIEVFGARIGRKDNDQVLIFVGEFELKFGSVSTGQTKNLNARSTIKFPSNNTFTEKPYVAIAIEDPTNTSGNMSFVVASITDLRKDGFMIRGRRLLPPSGKAESDTIRGTYIAIGPGVSRA